MPIYVKKEKDEKNEKAVKVFTDRLEPREVFWNNYKAMDNMSDGEQIPIKVITYYGIGGVGKSSLLKEIRKEISEKAKDTKYCYIDFEKLVKFKDDVLGILNAIKAQLNRDYKFEFPLFDLAAYEYNIRTGVDASKPELESIFSKNKDLGFMVNVIGEIPLIGTFAKIATLVDEGSNVIRNRFKDKKLRETVDKLDNLELDEIKEILPYYFAMDLQENLKDEKHPFVFQFDTYERLVNELTVVGSITRIDDWLKGENGLINNVSNVLWVIAGREKLRWQEENEEWKGTLEQHLLGDLSLIDSTSFLKSAGIKDEKVINLIYEITSGIPMYLDMCVDTYYKSLEKNKEINLEDFSGNKTKLIERFFTYMNDQEKDFVTILSFIGNWTDDNIEDQIKTILGTFSFNLYEKIKNFSFVIHEGDNYKIHETIRNVVTEKAPELIKNKFKNAIKEKQEETIRNIQTSTVETTTTEKVDTKSDKNKKTEKNSKENKKSEENKESDKGIIYLESIKRDKYKAVIDEIVLDIEEFLYQKPPFKKSTKKEYCEKVANLIEKLEDYLRLFNTVYDYKKLQIIVDNKLFKQTYEYKRLVALYKPLARFQRATLPTPDNLKIYYRTRNIYKDDKEKIKPITYMVKILGDPRYTKGSKGFKFRDYELEEYKKILKKYSTVVPMEYMMILYSKRDIKEFNKEFIWYFNLKENTNVLEEKRFILQYSLALLYEEFKGKPGKGYIFKDYNMRKNALKEYEETKLEFVNTEDKNEFVNNYIIKRKKEFIGKYLNHIMELIYNDRQLISISTLEMLIKVLDALRDEYTNEDLKLKLFKMLFEFKVDIFNSNMPTLINKYHDIMYKFSKFKDIYSKDFINENKKDFDELKTNSINLFEDFSKKYAELYTERSRSSEEELYDFLPSIMMHYNDFKGPIKYYQKFKELYGIESNQVNEIRRKWFIRIREINVFDKIEEDGQDLIDVFEMQYFDFESLMKKYFKDYKNIDKDKAKMLDAYWVYFSQLAAIIYYKTGYNIYYKKILHLFSSLIYKLDSIPIYNFYRNFGYMLENIHGYFEDINKIEILDDVIDLFYNVYTKNRKDLSGLKDSTVYKIKDYHLDLAILAHLILVKIAYENYLTEKDKEKIRNNIPQTDKELCITLYKYISCSYYRIRTYNNVYSFICNLDNPYQNLKEMETELSKYSLQYRTLIQCCNHTKYKEFSILVFILLNSTAGREHCYYNNESWNKDWSVKRIIEKKFSGLFKDKKNKEDYDRLNTIVDILDHVYSLFSGNRSEIAQKAKKWLDY